MGICRSTCAHGQDLEYYEGYRLKSTRNSRMRTRMMDRRTSSRPTTKLWMCRTGCCSIRLKLDYAEFQSYLKYAEISPYVVIQDKTRTCCCVICKGRPDLSRSGSDCASLTDRSSMDTERLSE